MCDWKAPPRTSPSLSGGTEQRQTPGHGCGDKIVCKICSCSTLSLLAPLLAHSPPPDRSAVPVSVRCGVSDFGQCSVQDGRVPLPPPRPGSAPPQPHAQLPFPPPCFCTSSDLVPREGQRHAVLAPPPRPAGPTTHAAQLQVSSGSIKNSTNHLFTLEYIR